MSVFTSVSIAFLILRRQIDHVHNTYNERELTSVTRVVTIEKCGSYLYVRSVFSPDRRQRKYTDRQDSHVSMHDLNFPAPVEIGQVTYASSIVSRLLSTSS